MCSSIGALQAVAIVVLVLCDRRLVATGRGDVITTVYDPETWLLLAAVISASGVGLVVAARQPRHPVGWLFLALSSSTLANGGLDEWWAFSAQGSGTLPGGNIAATLADIGFVPWFALLALVLLLTPTGTYLSPRWRRVGTTTAVMTLLTMASMLLSDREFEGHPGARNPFAVEAISREASITAQWTLLALAGCLLLGGLSLVLRFRRATGDGRRQLLWLVVAVVPLPVLVVATFAAAYAEIEWLKLAAATGFLISIPVVAGLSVLRYRLYDVERVVVATLTYSLSTSILVGVYGGLVWTGAQLSSGLASSPRAAATVGALTAALIATPLRRTLQERLDRRFNRREHDARRTVATGLAVDRAGVDVEALLRVATGDAELTVSFLGADGVWLSAAGAPARETAASVDATRGDRVVAKIGFDPDRSSNDSMRRIAELVVAELDNSRLRAALAAKVAEVEESRLRIAEVQRDERRRIERDLHDGAQQMLLALAYRLQAAFLGGDPERMRAALQSGSADAGAAARELRALANGLHPRALAEGGLSAALDDLARSSPVPITTTCTVDRVDPGVEFAVWLVIAEAVVNSQKHSDASSIIIEVTHDDQLLRFRIVDDGHGGADPKSTGLRGLVDRVEASGGRVTITTSHHGTDIDGVIPCAS